MYSQIFNWLFLVCSKIKWFEIRKSLIGIFYQIEKSKDIDHFLTFIIRFPSWVDINAIKEWRQWFVQIFLVRNSSSWLSANFLLPMIMNEIWIKLQSLSINIWITSSSELSYYDKYKATSWSPFSFSSAQIWHKSCTIHCIAGESHLASSSFRTFKSSSITRDIFRWCFSRCCIIWPELRD